MKDWKKTIKVDLKEAWHNQKTDDEILGMRDSNNCIIKEGDTIAQENSYPLMKWNSNKAEVRFWHVIDWLEGKRHLIGKDYSWNEVD